MINTSTYTTTKMAEPRIHTYHCICTNLLLATTHKLSTLPQRKTSQASPSATILPLVFPTTDTSTDTSTSATPFPPTSNGYTTLLALNKSPKPTVVRQTDGFEKRWLYRCGRCAVVVGYELDEEHFASAAGAGAGAAGGAAEERPKIFYVLPGGLLSTEVMKSGRKFEEGELALGGTGKVGVAVWE